MNLSLTRTSKRSGSVTVYEGSLYAARPRRSQLDPRIHRKRSPQGAGNVKQAIKKTIEFIGWYPQVGRYVDFEETRVLPVGRYPYLIYWSVRAGEVWIVHIRHAFRRPWEGEN